MEYKNILIVDDKKENAEEIKTYLDVIGIKDGVSISDGYGALEKAVIENLDLVLVNEELIDISGSDLCKFIKRTKQGKTKTILISDLSEPSNSNRNKEHFADKCVIRTPYLEYVINAVRELIS